MSSDFGRSWSPLVDLEPSDGPEASYGVPLLTSSGRIYAFYTYNGDRITSVPGESGRVRTDILGWYCYRYSDDGGCTWSKERYRLPMRVTACDRGNNWNGKVQLFWGIDKPKIHDGAAAFAFTKLGRYMLEDGEGWLYYSDNVLTEPDVEKLHWELRPVGDHGIRASEFGSVQEEHNHVPLGGDRLYMVYRTTTGYPCHCYSDDAGRTWSKPETFRTARKFFQPGRCSARGSFGSPFACCPTVSFTHAIVSFTHETNVPGSRGGPTFLRGNQSWCETRTKAVPGRPVHDFHWATRFGRLRLPRGIAL